MVSAIVETVGTVGAAAIGANAAKDASNQQAASIAQAQGISKEAAAQARADILGTFDPSFKDISTGIQGAIDQLTSGRQVSSDIIQGFTQQGIDATRAGTQAATSALQGSGQIGNVAGVPSSVSRIGGVGSAQDFLTQGGIDAQNILGQGIQAGVSEIEQFAGTGEQALQQEAALSGALGPEAQAQAQAAYSDSPGQEYFREQQRQALLRSQAAIGGLGGGNVRTALQEQAFGIAATDQQRYLENLRSIASRGQQAAGQQAGFQVQGGITGSGLVQQQSQAQQQAAQAEVQSRRNQAAAQAQLNQQRALAEAAAMRSQAATQAGLDQQRAFGLAGIAERGGSGQAGLLQAAGQQALGANQQADVNIANLIAGGGQSLAGLRTGTGTSLANIAIGQGAQQAGLQQALGSAQAAGTLGQNTAFQQGISGLGTIAGQRL